MPPHRTMEEMLGNYDIEVVPVGDKYIVTWKSVGSDEPRAQVFDNQRDADRFALNLNPIRSIGILRMHFSRGEMPSYDELRNARRGMRELERELRDDPSMMDRIRAALAIRELDAALRDADRTEPNLVEKAMLQKSLFDLEMALAEVEREERGETPVPLVMWGGRRDVRVRGHRRKHL